MMCAVSVFGVFWGWRIHSGKQGGFCGRMLRNWCRYAVVSCSYLGHHIRKLVVVGFGVRISNVFDLDGIDVNYIFTNNVFVVKHIQK